MYISDRLKNFLIENKIYSLEKLSQQSMTFIIGLKSYSSEIGQELLKYIERERIKYSHNINSISETSEVGKTVNLISSDNTSKYSMIVNKLDAPKTIYISNRLSHIISNYQYCGNLIEFLQLDNNTLLNINNFGIKCLKEIKSIRKILSIKPHNKYFIETICPRYNIPADIAELKFEELFLYSNQCKGLTQNIITKVKNVISNFGELHGKTNDELLAIRGVGKKTIANLITILSYVHLGSFANLLSNLRANINPENNIEIPIIGSYLLFCFIHKHKILSIYDILKFDSIDNSNLDYLDRIAFIGLRTLYYNPKNNSIETRINTYKGYDLNFPYDIDNFLDSGLIKKQWKEFILFRYDIYGRKISMEEIAQLKGITRERVRQIIQNVFDIFKLCYISSYDFFLKIFLNIIQKEARPIVFSDIFHDSKKNLVYSPSFYLAFLSDLFDVVPFENYLLTENRKIFDNVLSIIKSKADYPFTTTLDNLLNDLGIKERLIYLHAIFSSGSMFLEKKKDKIYLNKDIYPVDALLKCLSYEIDRPALSA